MNPNTSHLQHNFNSNIGFKITYSNNHWDPTPT